MAELGVCDLLAIGALLEVLLPLAGSRDAAARPALERLGELLLLRALGRQRRNLCVIESWRRPRLPSHEGADAAAAKRLAELRGRTLQERAEAMRLWCVEQGIEMLELTLQFCLREERIHGNPCGSLNVEQLEKNVAAAMASVADATIENFKATGL